MSNRLKRASIPGSGFLNGTSPDILTVFTDMNESMLDKTDRNSSPAGSWAYRWTSSTSSEARGARAASEACRRRRSPRTWTPRSRSVRSEMSAGRIERKFLY